MLWHAAPMHDERKLALIDADHRRLVRAAARLLGPADAEDAVQDAYVRALEAEPQSLNAAQAWLLTVVRHLAIDRLRRNRWLQTWLAEVGGSGAERASPSAASDAALAQDIALALRVLATRLTPAEGAAVLLHEVFEVGHAEIAAASGKSEAGGRQHLRRALSRLRARPGAPAPQAELEAGEEALFHLYLRSLQLRHPQALWAMLRQPPIRAVMQGPGGATEVPEALPATTSSIVQVGGQLGLALTLDGVTLCVMPLGVLPACDADMACCS